MISMTVMSSRETLDVFLRTGELLPFQAFADDDAGIVRDSGGCGVGRPIPDSSCRDLLPGPRHGDPDVLAYCIWFAQSRVSNQ